MGKLTEKDIKDISDIEDMLYSIAAYGDEDRHITNKVIKEFKRLLLIVRDEKKSYQNG